MPMIKGSGLCRGRAGVRADTRGMHRRAGDEASPLRRVGHCGDALHKQVRCDYIALC